MDRGTGTSILKKKGTCAAVTNVLLKMRGMFCM